jgi:hypothetical protein
VLKINFFFLSTSDTLGHNSHCPYSFPNNGMYESKWGCFSKTNIFHFGILSIIYNIIKQGLVDG